MRHVEPSLRSPRVWLTGLLAALVVGAFVAPAEAITAQGSFRARAQVFSGCTLATSELVIPVARGQVTPGFGVTSFVVSCPAASVTNQLPVRFSFSTATGTFAMKENATPRLLPYDLCNDSACAEVYTVGVPGPVVSVPSSSWNYRLYGRAIPPPTGMQPGNFKQQVTATLMY